MTEYETDNDGNVYQKPEFRHVSGLRDVTSYKINMQIKLISVLDEIILNPIVREMIIEDINGGTIATEEELKEKAEEYTNML